MENEELEARYLRLVEKVDGMRKAQNLYFDTRTKDALIAAKNWEAELDLIIAREIKKQKSGQKDLF